MKYIKGMITRQNEMSFTVFTTKLNSVLIYIVETHDCFIEYSKVQKASCRKQRRTVIIIMSFVNCFLMITRQRGVSVTNANGNSNAIQFHSMLCS